MRLPTPKSQSPTAPLPPPPAASQSRTPIKLAGKCLVSQGAGRGAMPKLQKVMAHAAQIEAEKQRLALAGEIVTASLSAYDVRKSDDMKPFPLSSQEQQSASYNFKALSFTASLKAQGLVGKAVVDDMKADEPHVPVTFSNMHPAKWSQQGWKLLKGDLLTVDLAKWFDFQPIMLDQSKNWQSKLFLPALVPGAERRSPYNREPLKMVMRLEFACRTPHLTQQPVIQDQIQENLGASAVGQGQKGGCIGVAGQ
ncbi:hypothetical protein QFC22_002068 [Naganishia vaughanmartiniae]|uniref:Uncharacterized protein n=1 Tax=Naganishia vaughanmartiniae TaxID=1424756 RepID=A0ACC2XDV2_9TREE|nr:hypothetical protein QFC22_002068 [Naganishia vaughanmartiniae]